MDVRKIALELRQARLTGGLVTPPSQRHPVFSLEDGYAVARILHAEALASGSGSVGLKLGFTNQAIWHEVGLDSPIWAPIYDTSVTTETEVSLANLVTPRIEPEIVLGFKADLASGAQSAQVSAALGWVAPGFEIVQCHYPGWQMATADAVADAGLHGILVVGEQLEVDSPDGYALADVEVAVRRGNNVIACGRGSDVLGGPVHAVTWLLRLPGINGLPAGTIVTTGTLTAACPVAAGETWQLDATGPISLRQLKVRFASLDL
jgi:2-keto-4-pentenoate hydratase